MIGSLFSKKLRNKKVGHKFINESLGKDVLGDCFWFHAASLGEFEQGKPVLEALKKEYPNLKVLLTFFSPSGYEVKKNWRGADVVAYMPFDSKKEMRNFLAYGNIKFAVFVKYEFWFNTLQLLNDRKIPVYFISAIFREDQYFFKPYGKWFAKKLKLVDHFFVQNDASKNLLNQLGVFNVTVSGDTRFDAVNKIKDTHYVDDKLVAFLGKSKCLVLGSIWGADLGVVGPALCDLLKQYSDLKIVIAPHELEGTDYNFISNYFSSSSVLYSATSTKVNSQVLVIDKIGVLKYIYRYASITYIGGGFGSGIHNILEPMVYGCPIIFGPKHQKFDEARQALELELAKSISSSSEFKKYIELLLQNPSLLAVNKLRSEIFVKENLGSANRIINLLKNDLSMVCNNALN